MIQIGGGGGGATTKTAGDGEKLHGVILGFRRWFYTIISKNGVRTDFHADHLIVWLKVN